jgi:ribosomal protein S18 acetylase RimI-like enzyme
MAEVIDIPRERRDEAAEVLARAFVHDPLMLYLFAGKSQPEGYYQRLRAFYEFLCLMCLDLESPLVGCQVGDNLTGVACVLEPDHKAWPDSLTKAFEDLETVIGAEAICRTEACMALSHRFRPKRPHYSLVALGVHPAAQGRGHGRRLLDAVQALSEAHAQSTGVALETENAANVPFYEHCGYQVTARTNLEDVDVWCMFRPNRATGRG